MAQEKGFPRAASRLSSPAFLAHRDVLRTIGERGPADPLDMFVHDIRNFGSIALSARFYGEAAAPMQDLLHLPPSELIQVTDEQIAEALAGLPDLTTAGDEEMGCVKKVVSGVQPFLGEIFPVMRDSIGFLMAVNEGDSARQKEWLRKLFRRKLPLEPIVDFYEGTFFIDGLPEEPEEVKVDGVLFMIIHNIAKNAQIHGSDMEIEYESQFGFVNYLPDTRSWTVMSFNMGMEYRALRSNLAQSNESLGLVATRIYAAVLGKKITVDTAPIGRSLAPYYRLLGNSPDNVVEFEIS